MSIYRKLMDARMALHKREIKKTGRNTFANYNYMELGDFLVPTQTIFAELGLCGVVSFTADIASLTITDIDDGAQIVITSPMGSAALKGCHEVQNVGAVETYQRRYLWVTAMEIVEHDALDSSPPVEKTDSLVPVLEASIAQAETKKTGALQAAADDAAKRLDAPSKTALAKLAFEVGELFKKPEGTALAYTRVEMDELNGDEKTYLWGMLSSPIRSALKREGQTRALMHNQPETV